MSLTRPIHAVLTALVFCSALAACGQGEVGTRKGRRIGRVPDVVGPTYARNDRDNSATLGAAAVIGIWIASELATRDRALVAERRAADPFVAAYARRLVQDFDLGEETRRAMIDRLAIVPEDSDESLAIAGETGDVVGELERTDDFETIFLDREIAAQERIVAIIDESELCGGAALTSAPPCDRAIAEGAVDPRAFVGMMRASLGARLFEAQYLRAQRTAPASE